MAVVRRDGRTFYYTDCGHLVGCDDPDFDLEAEQERIRSEYFEKQLDAAIRGRRRYSHVSSSPLDLSTEDILDAIQDKPTAELIQAARRVFSGEPYWSTVELETRLKAARFAEPLVVFRFNYWDGTPGIRTGLWGEATYKPRHDEQDKPAPGNAFFKVGSIFDRSIFEALQKANMVGETVRTVKRYNECRVLV